MAGDAFSKIKSAANRSITKISVKTQSSLEKSKIRMHMDSLTKDVQAMLTDIGEGVYGLWLSGETSCQSLAEKLEAVKNKRAEIEALGLELASIDDRDSEILGTREAAPKPEAPPPIPICPNCQNPYEEGARFCRRCGQKLV